MLEKCCCCFSLKFGFLAYVTLCLALRVTAACTLYWIPTVILNNDLILKHLFFLPSLGFSIGWLVATSFCLYLTLKGIMQERSVLLFPFIVILIFEMILMVCFYILLGIVVHLGILINIPIVVAIDGYSAACLISLYKAFKMKEERTLEEGYMFKTV